MAIDVKKLLADSLLELSNEKPLEKISVTDIVKHAGAGRQTFYNHFKDKNDLLYWIYKQTLVGEKEIIEKDGFVAYLYNVYEEAQKKYSSFLQAACKLTGQNSLTDAIIFQSYSYYRNYIKENFGEEVFDDRLKFALRYQAYGAGYHYVQWAIDGMPGSAREHVQFIIHCMPACIKQYLPLTEEELQF